jgi:hypothetical protein
MLFKAILVGFPKSQRTLVAFVSVLLSETAGAGNGLNRPVLPRKSAWISAISRPGS